MASTTFPDDRLVYSLPEYGTVALGTGAGQTITVYQDAQGTIPAVITLVDGSPIPGAIVVVGPDSLLPQWLDPQGRTTLWGRTQGTSTPYRIDAIVSDQIRISVTDDIDAAVADYLSTHPVEGVAEAQETADEALALAQTKVTALNGVAGLWYGTEAEYQDIHNGPGDQPGVIYVTQG